MKVYIECPICGNEFSFTRNTAEIYFEEFCPFCSSDIYIEVEEHYSLSYDEKDFNRYFYEELNEE